jgi:hypothetical protein
MSSPTAIRAKKTNLSMVARTIQKVTSRARTVRTQGLKSRLRRAAQTYERMQRTRR